MSLITDVMHQPGPSLTGAFWAIVALRAAWLLPDWIGKWQRLLGRRRVALEQPGARRVR